MAGEGSGMDGVVSRMVDCPWKQRICEFYPQTMLLKRSTVYNCCETKELRATVSEGASFP